MTAASHTFCTWEGPDLIVWIRVIPRAQTTAIAGVRHERLLVRLQAPPAHGEANRALTRYIAHWCGVRRGAVTIEAGEKSRDKRIRIGAPATLPSAFLRGPGA